MVSLDPNYHPQIWPDQAEARAVLKDLYRYVTITKPSLDDAARLFGAGLAPETYLEHFHALGPRIILTTSVHTQETPDGSLDLVMSVGGETMFVRTPLLPISVSGAGDATAALLFVHLLEGRAPGEATALTASSVYGLLKRTVDAGSREILTVAAQDEFVSPTTRFETRPL